MVGAQLPSLCQPAERTRRSISAEILQPASEISKMSTGKKYRLLDELRRRDLTDAVYCRVHRFLQGHLFLTHLGGGWASWV